MSNQAWTIADAKKRIYAAIIDFIVIAFLFVLSVYIFRKAEFIQVIKEFFSTFHNDLNDFNTLLINISNKQSLYFFLTSFGLYFLYTVMLPLVSNGRTLGRIMFGIRIVKLNETRMSFGTLLIRQIIVGLCFSIFTFGLTKILDIVLLFKAKGRRVIEDKTSNTLVIQRGIRIK